MNKIKSDKEALDIAAKVIKAQERLLTAYRIGGRPSESTLDTLSRLKPRLEDYFNGAMQ